MLRRAVSYMALLLRILKDQSGRSLRAVAAGLRICFETLYRPDSLRWALIVATSFLGALVITPDFFPDASFVVGEVAETTVVSSITFKIMDEAATQRSRDEALKSVRPVYDFDDEVIHDTLSRISTAFSFMREYLNAEAAYRSRKSGDTLETLLAQSHGLLGSGAFRPMDDDTLRTRFQGLLGARVSPSGFALLKSRGFSCSIQTDLRSLIVPVLLRGVVERRDPVLNEGKQGILFRIKSKDSFELVKDVSAISDVKQAISFINSWKNDSVRDTALSRTIRLLAMDLVAVNVTYNPQKSLQNRQKAAESVKPVYFQVSRGAPIIKAGEPVNEGHARMLAGLVKALPPHGQRLIQIGLTFMLAFWMGICVRFCENRFRKNQIGTGDVAFICLLFIGTTCVVRLIASLTLMLPTTSATTWRLPALLAAPVAAGAMLATLRSDARTGFVVAALLSVTAAFAANSPIQLFLFYLVSGIVGLICMTRITDRTSLLRAAMTLGLANVATVVAIKLTSGSLPSASDFREFALAFSGGLLSVCVVYAIASFSELLGHPTSVGLAKMGDLNHPLLKQMALDAPGTYQHSIRVANLAEIAAEQIGADPLLARVAGLYHDIGKTGRTANPSTYIENQGVGEKPRDKRDRIETVAALVSHVVHGVERAKEYGLAQPIVDVIQQHHGTDRVRLPQRRPREKAEGAEDQRYESPRPTTKEAAVVMLANIVEPTCRALPNLTPGSVQKQVKKSAFELFTDGQFDESPLTLKDLDVIIRSFTRTLLEMRAGFSVCVRGAGTHHKLLYREPSNIETRDIQSRIGDNLPATT
jgi:putative nucleotidyltransferase with HDIG domain